MQLRSIILFGLLFFSVSVYAQTDWKEDIEFLRTELPAKHINFFAINTKKAWNDGLDRIKQNMQGKDDVTIVLEIDRLITSFGDSHTGLGWSMLLDKKKMLPAKFYWFSDGIYITQTTKSNEVILGKKIIDINDVPVEQVSKNLSSLTSLDNNALMMSRAPKLLPMIQVLQYLEIVKGNDVVLTIEDTLGKRVDHKIILMEGKDDIVKIKPATIPFAWSNERMWFVEKYFPEDSTYFIQYNKCWSKELEDQYNNGKNSEALPSFRDFEEKVFKNIEANPIRKLIVDLRFNSGGNSKQGTDFIHRIEANKKVNRKGVLYVITGRQTYSSAVINATDFKNFTAATFVGEETSGKPNHFGEVKDFELPSSHIKVVYSTRYFEKEKGNNKTFVPDYKYSPSFSEFINGIDPATTAIRTKLN